MSRKTTTSGVSSDTPGDPLDRLLRLAEATPPSRERDWLTKLLKDGADEHPLPLRKRIRHRGGKKLRAPI